MKKLVLAVTLFGLAGVARAAAPTGLRPIDRHITQQAPEPHLGLDDRGTHGSTPIAPPATPEPLTMGALALGAAGIAAAKLRKKKS